MAELQGFIFRTQALHLYRSFLRAIRGAPAESQGKAIPSGWASCLRPMTSCCTYLSCSLAMSATLPDMYADSDMFKVDVLNAADLFKEVRQGFESSRKFQDAYAMKYSLSNGRVQLKQLRDMLGMRL